MMDYAQAKVSYEKALPCDANNPITHYNYAVLLAKHFPDGMCVGSTVVIVMRASSLAAYTPYLLAERVNRLVPLS
jgi:hypothetical protein